MAVTGQQIADDAWATLSDKTGGTGVRWPAAEVLAAINDGQREIVMLHPQALVKSAKAVLTADTRQTFSTMGITDGLQIIRALRNWSADGNTVGRAVSKVEMAVLDAQLPTWHSEAAGEAVENWCTDPLEPSALYVYPKVSGSKRLEVVYAAIPSDLATLASNIGLPDLYRSALKYYVLYSLLSKRVQGSPAMRAEGDRHYQRMLQALGLRAQTTAATDEAVTQKDRAA